MGLESATSFEAIRARVGTPLGTSQWVSIDQAWIDDFARVTRDHDPMHVDPQWAAEHSPYGTTVAFGFQTLSLLTWLQHEVVRWPGNALYGLNYGFDRLRFVAPVPVNSRIRAHFALADASRDDDGRIRLETDVQVEIEGEQRPALVARWLALLALRE